MELHVGKLTATRRTGTGKSVTRKLRAKGLIPAVVYGQGGASESLVVDPRELHAALDPDKKQNTLIALTVQSDDGGDAEQQSVMLKDFQIHALKQSVLHADFIRVGKDTVVHADVPLELTGRPVGVQMGGVINQVLLTVPTESTPASIPGKISADITDLDIGGHLRARDLQLPEGVKVCLPPEQTLAIVVAPRGVDVAAEGEGEAAEGEGEAAAVDDK